MKAKSKRLTVQYKVSDLDKIGRKIEKEVKPGTVRTCTYKLVPVNDSNS